MNVLEVSPEGFLLKSGGYIASEASVTFDTQWGGAKGFFGGQGLLLLKVSGAGKVLFGCYGALEERVLEPDETYFVDTGHIVGMDSRWCRR
jgi:uncharacterized protein (AIM24 family)